MDGYTFDIRAMSSLRMANGVPGSQAGRIHGSWLSPGRRILSKGLQVGGRH
jgi:hypothetical protein